MLFSLQVFGDSPAIYVIDFSHNFLVAKHEFCTILYLLNLLRCILWLRMCSILVNVSHEHDKIVYSILLLLDEILY